MLDMSNVEKAMIAFRNIDEAHRKEVLAMLLALAVACPRHAKLRLVVNNR